MKIDITKFYLMINNLDIPEDLKTKIKTTLDECTITNCCVVEPEASSSRHLRMHTPLQKPIQQRGE